MATAPSSPSTMTDVAASLTAAGGVFGVIGTIMGDNAKKKQLLAEAQTDFENADLANLNARAVLDFGEINATTTIAMGNLNAQSALFTASLQSKATLGYAGIEADATTAIGELNASTAETVTGLNIGARDAVGAYAGAVSDANYNLTMAAGKFNQDAAEINTQQVEQRGRQQVSQTQLKYGGLKSSQIASMAANGVALDSDSSLRVLTTTDWQEDTDVNTIATNTANAALGYRVQGQLAMNDATIRGLAIKADALGAKFNLNLQDTQDRGQTALYAADQRGESQLKAFDTRTAAQMYAFSLTAEAQNTALGITTTAGLDAMNTRTQSKMTALGYQTQAFNYTSAGQGALTARKSINTGLDVAGSIINTATKVASMFAA